MKDQGEHSEWIQLYSLPNSKWKYAGLNKWEDVIIILVYTGDVLITHTDRLTASDYVHVYVHVHEPITRADTHDQARGLRHGSSLINMPSVGYK